MISIINYGLGNLGSIKNALNRLGHEVEIVHTPEEVSKAERLLLPGVGHFTRAMEQLERLNLREALDRRVLEDKVPILGICLGMQIMTCGSEESNIPGLGWVDAQTRYFASGPNFPQNRSIPHMGWNRVVSADGTPLAEGLEQDAEFYFMHSYYVECSSGATIFKTRYGLEFTSGFQQENIIGVQFHPEKSHSFGSTLMKNFAEWRR